MNISNRISKLEKRTSGFCECKATSKIENYLQDLTEDAETNEAILMGDLVPDVCPICTRNINKDKSILQLIEQS